MKNTFYILYLIFAIFSSCTEEVPVSEINFSNVDLKYTIAVDGFICNEKERCRITLRKPVPISEEIEIIPINDASIVLKHLNNTYEFQYDTNGVYYTVDSIIGIAGDIYTLEISYHGKTYTAEEIMPDPPDEEFNIPFYYYPAHDGNGNPIPYDKKFGSIVVQIHNFGYNKTNIWKFTVTRYINDPLPINYLFYSRFTCIYTHKGIHPQGVFPPENVFTGTGDGASATDSIEVIKAEISEQYDQYLRDKFNETDWQGKMFSTIPGNVSTNLSEGAIGYFYTLNVKRKRFQIKDMVNFD